MDEAEGADIMMVKPGMPYLYFMGLIVYYTTLPIAAYHVSGECELELELAHEHEPESKRANFLSS